jgi:hypothetical protein
MPDDVDSAATASCLVRLLRSLEEPVIPFWAYHSAIEAAKARDPGGLSSLLARMSPLHSNVFAYIIRLLREMPFVRDGSGVQEVAELFGEALLAPDKARTGRDLRDRAAFVRLALKGEKDAPYGVIVIDIAKSSLHLGSRSKLGPHHGHHHHRSGQEHRHEHRHDDRSAHRSEHSS